MQLELLFSGAACILLANLLINLGQQLPIRVAARAITNRSHDDVAFPRA